MKKSLQILSFALVLCVVLPLMSSCKHVERQVDAIEHTLRIQQLHAEQVSMRVERALNAELVCIDSIRAAADDEQVLSYVFQGDRMLYWSDNWLALDSPVFFLDSEWHYQRFRNAHVVLRWTHTQGYSILSVVPVKYGFPFENRQLHNTFIPPFSGDEEWAIYPTPSAEHLPVTGEDGKALFYLCPHHLEEEKTVSGPPLAESFSYQQLLSREKEAANFRAHRARVRLYFLITIALFAFLFVWGVVTLVRHRGFRNMRLGTKMQFVVMTLLLVSFVYIFVMSVIYVRRNSERRQKDNLQAKCRYVQSTLRHIYSDRDLQTDTQEDINRGLRSLSLTYETDIHLYGANGELLGSSTPALFSEGLTSRKICPDVIFARDSARIQYENIGDMHYLVSYAALYNNFGTKIGYLALPSFVSQPEVMQQVDNYLMRLLPVYLIMFIVALFSSLLVNRSLTHPLHLLSERMRDYRIGGKHSNVHLEYRFNDEVGELVHQYNAMVDQLESSSRRLALSERDAAWRTMARQIAHEINNPLTPMKLTIQQLQRTKGTERFDEYFDRATRMLVEQIDTLSRIASSFSSFAKMPEVRVSEVDVAERLSAVITLMRQNDQQIPIRYIGPDRGVMAWTDPEQIAQVFTNIIKNALQALDNKPDGDIIVMLNHSVTEPANFSAADTVDMDTLVEIVISDNAGGIQPEFRDKIFMPNFTTKSYGTGLGLAISKNIIESGEGKICFQTSEKGTKFFVYLKKKQ